MNPTWQPLRYIRTNLNFPIKPVAEYFFATDSVVRHINIIIETKDSSNIFLRMYSTNPKNIVDTFNKQYDLIKAGLVNLYGPSSPFRELKEKQFSGSVYGERIDYWEKDNLNSGLYMMLNKDEKVLRIRAEINFTAPRKIPKQ